MVTRLSLLPLLVAAGLSAGCATELAAFYNRSVVKDNIGDSLGTVSLSSDRRTVLVGVHGDRRGRFCAEPPPDSATSLKTDLAASLKASGKTVKVDASVDAGLNNKTETTVKVLADRTPALDAFRTGVYALCQYNLNGAVADGQVGDLFVKLIDAYERTAQNEAIARAAEAKAQVATKEPAAPPSPKEATTPPAGKDAAPQAATKQDANVQTAQRN